MFANAPAAWRCGKKSIPELSDYYQCVRHKTNYKLSLNLPYCQTAVM